MHRASLEMGAPSIAREGAQDIVCGDYTQSILGSFPPLSEDTLREGEWYYTDGTHENVPCDLDKRT